MNMSFELPFTMYLETGQNLKNWYDYIWKGLEKEGKTEKEGEKKCRNCENVDFMVFSENRFTSSLKHVTLFGT